VACAAICTHSLLAEWGMLSGFGQVPSIVLNWIFVFRGSFEILSRRGTAKRRVSLSRGFALFIAAHCHL